MNMGLIALIILILSIVAAVITKRCTAALFVGSIVSAMFLYGKDFIVKWTMALQEVVADNAWLWLVCGLFGILIMMLKLSKGTLGFSGLMEKLCKSQRSSLLAAFIMGVIIFIDDYLNVLTVGVCMKDLFDKRKLPRESLAFILDSTGAPICVLLPFSSWAAFYGMLFMEHESISSMYKTSIGAYVSAIPFMFYPIIVVIIVLLFCLGLFPKVGSMKKAYERVEQTGMVYSEASRKYNYDMGKKETGKGHLIDFALPMLIMIVICIITGEILNGLVVAIIVAILMYLLGKKLTMDQITDAARDGFSDMISVIFLITACFITQKITCEMGMVDFITSLIKPIITVPLMPMIAFVLVAVLAFATGSSWGMSAMAIPIFIPLAASIGANMVLTMAAIVSGGTFGAHACFYADATVLASKSACIDNLDHAASQMPYVLIAALLSMICFGVCGFIMA